MEHAFLERFHAALILTHVDDQHAYIVDGFRERDKLGRQSRFRVGLPALESLESLVCLPDLIANLDQYLSREVRRFFLACHRLVVPDAGPDVQGHRADFRRGPEKRWRYFTSPGSRSRFSSGAASHKLMYMPVNVSIVRLRLSAYTSPQVSTIRTTGTPALLRTRIDSTV